MVSIEYPSRLYSCSVSCLLKCLGFTSDIAITCGGVELLFILRLSSVSLSFVNTSEFEYHTIISPTHVSDLGWSFRSFVYLDDLSFSWSTSYYVEDI